MKILSRAFLCVALCACTRGPATGSDEWLAREGKRFREDTPYRRAALEHSLTNHENLYSQERLGAYALGDRGWDLLPEWNPRSAALTKDRAEALAKGAAPEAPAEPLWDGREPQTQAEWIALGRRVFLTYPMRADQFMEFALTKPALAASLGIERTAAGEVPGLVEFKNVDGHARVGITCALCHSHVVDGALVIGSARRRFDYGRLRITYFAETGDPVDPETVRRMATWGPGRADVTEDNDEDPVTIPDLWGVHDQSFLTQTGAIRHDSPLALAIRQETQLTDSNHLLVRPPRTLVWALTMFVESLTPPASAPVLATSRGALLFAEHCRGCHSNASRGGGQIPVATIGTNPALANGHGRGTGAYRTPPLVRVRDGAPYLHDGAIASLDELLSPDRLATKPGHSAGTTLSPADRAALISFLDSL